MDQQLERLRLQFGEENLAKLQQAKVLIVGCGGVGSYAAEALARSGIGHLVLMDHDVVEVSNLNRQIMATYETLQVPKVEAMKKRIETYNDACKVEIHQAFFDETSIDVLKDCDFVIDAIDTVKSKVSLYKICHDQNVPFISSLGMGNRIDPSCIEVSELMKTEYDPLAKAVRSMVRKEGLKFKIPVLFSREIPKKQNEVVHEEGKTRKQMIPPASTIFVPAAAGLLAASQAVQVILGGKK